MHHIFRRLFPICRPAKWPLTCVIWLLNTWGESQKIIGQLLSRVKNWPCLIMQKSPLKKKEDLLSVRNNWQLLYSTKNWHWTWRAWLNWREKFVNRYNKILQQKCANHENVVIFYIEHQYILFWQNRIFTFVFHL